MNSDHEVERILGDRVKNQFVQYLVKWKNFSHSHNSWVNEFDLIEKEALIQEYLKNKEELKKIRQNYPKNATKPFSIVGAFRANKKLYYEVIYNNSEIKDKIEAKDMHRIDPIQCIEFLEQRRTFKTNKMS